MSINQLKVQLNKDVPINRLDNNLEIGNKTGNKDSGVKRVVIRFNDRFKLELQELEHNEVIVTMTSGGVSKEIDLQTFQQLITMNY